MEKQQAIQEVIKLKKQYGTGGDDKAISAQAEAIRQQYGLDANKYGSGATLADAYTNYYNEFGQGGGQQTPPQQQPQQPQYNQEEQLLGIQNMLQQNSDAYLQAQTANFERQLSQQIAQLESVYAQAVAEGQMSVRDAEQAFESQKGEIQKMAYQQAEATKVYGSEMGLQHSQQMVGLQQGDNARENSIHNANISDRDKRIADVRDRISMLNTQKGIATTQAQNEYGYNVASAQAQASQMYNQSMSDLMSQNYFTQMGMQHDYNLADKNQQYAKENMGIQQGYTQDNMRLQDGFARTMAELQNNLDIKKMYVGRDINLEVMEKEMATQLSNQLKIMGADYGYKSSLSAQDQRNAISRISAQASAQAKAAIDAADEARKLEAQKLGLDINATHNEIYEKQKQEADAAIIRSAATDAYGKYIAETTFNNPDINLNPSKPRDYTQNSDMGASRPVAGGLMNLLTGFTKDNARYNDEEARKKTAIDNRNAMINGLGLPSAYGN